MKVKRIGIDLAKNVFQLHGVDRHDQVVLKRRCTRTQWLKVLMTAAETECEIGMEACGGAHHWARVLEAHGYTVKLIPPQFVKPYVKSHKNDAKESLFTRSIGSASNALNIVYLSFSYDYCLLNRNGIPDNCPIAVAVGHCHFIDFIWIRPVWLYT